MLHARTRLGPRAIEEEAEPVMEQVQEARERAVVMVARPLARILRQVERQRTVGPEQTEESLLEAGRWAVRLVERRKRRRRESCGWLLRESHRLLGRTERPAEARAV